MRDAPHLAAVDRQPETTPEPGPISSGATPPGSDACAILRDAVRLHAAAGRYTAAQLAEAVGVKPSRVHDFCEGRQRLDLDLGLRLARALGDATVERLVACIGYSIARPPERDGPNPHAILAEGCRFDATLAEMLQDSRLDHVERRRLAPLAREQAARLIELAANCERGP